ncbi:MAG: sigma-54-dependent transcriptional regulator, partial [Candidatus Methylomirabilales bacterium]
MERSEISEILVVGGSSAAAAYIQGLVSSCSMPCVPIASWSEGRKIVGEIRERRFHAAVIDLDETPADGRRFLAALQREAPSIPIIVVTGEVNGRAEWVAAGAFEALTKPLSRAAVLTALHRAVTRSQLCAADGPGLAKPSKRSVARPLPEIIGDSEAMQEVYHWISKVAQSDANVCLYGDSGTGKELVARAIHETGRRRGRPFVVLDCAAIPEGLMESEMFGHVRGAFTSAVGDRIGVFQLADTGTLFLDEVAELPFPLQAKLLRLIQNREFRRVGSNHSIRVDVRILTATNRDLAALV